MYAIVDIETTGGHASAHGITEVAIIWHNGVQEEARFETLVNPGMPVPRHITALTGIDNAMLLHAPRFEAVAADIHAWLKDRVFVAHNVNFDYSFLRHHLQQEGYELSSRKLCTVRMARKVFPGLRSYSLGNLCAALDIPNRSRHRAMGDAEATSTVFGRIMANDQAGVVAQMLKAGSRDAYLPLHLDATAIDQLPMTPGVYYFHDGKDKVVYVGKAVNLRQRVTSHFSNNAPSRRKQELIRTIHRISYQEAGSAFAASLLESVEIRKRWPVFNLSQKRVEIRYGLYAYEDQRGIRQLVIEKKRRGHQPLHAFSLLTEGQALLRRLARDYGLCTSFLSLHAGYGACDGTCGGICRGEETVADYNQRVDRALYSLQTDLPSFLLREKGRTLGEQYVALMDRGEFYGFGFLDPGEDLGDKERLKTLLTPYADNAFVRSLMLREASLYPEKMLAFKA